MDVTLDVIFACKFFSDVILHVISDMHGERARCARRKFHMNFTYMTSITFRFCMDVTLDVNLQEPTLARACAPRPRTPPVSCMFRYEYASS